MSRRRCGLLYSGPFQRMWHPKGRGGFFFWRFWSDEKPNDINDLNAPHGWVSDLYREAFRGPEGRAAARATRLDTPGKGRPSVPQGAVGPAVSGVRERVDQEEANKEPSG